MTIPNYLALYNLSQIEADILIVSDLTATTGTIYTLSSTNGTITTLNSTTANISTANITNLIGNVWEGSSTTSNMRIGTTSDTSGVISIYKTMAMLKNLNFNTSTGMLYCSNFNSWNGGATDIAFSQGISLSSGKNITINGGYLIAETIRGYAFANAVNMYLSQVGAISFGNNLGTGGGITFNDNVTIASSRKITTPGILVSGLTASKLVLSDASKNIISSAYTDTDMAVLTLSNTFSGTSNTFSNTLLCNTLTGTTTGSAISLFGTSTSLIDLGNSVSTSIIRLNQNTSLTAGKILRTPYLYPTSSVTDLYIGNQATDSGTLFIELNMDLHSSRKLKLNNTTASKLLLTNSSKEIISSAYDETTLPVSTPTQTALNLKANINAPVFTTSIGLTSGDITISSGKLVNNTFQGTAVGSAISLFSTTTTADISLGEALTTGFILLGSGSGGGVISRDDLYLTTGVFPSTIRKTIFCNTIKSNSTIGLPEAGSLYDTNTSNNITCGAALTSGSIVLGRVGQTGVITCNTKLQANTLDGLATSSTITVGGALTNGLLILSNTSNTNAVRVNTKLQQSTASGNAYWNVAVGSANNVFQSSTLSTFAMPPISAATSPSAATWAVWETNAQGEGAFIAMNGDTTIMCNPGDTYALHWVDEDFITLATGFKFDPSGVMTVTSDTRAKTNINPYNKNNVLNKLHKIEMINYTKKRPDGITRKSADDKYAKIHTGYTAQQLIAIGLDEFVEQPTTPDGYMSVCYGNIQFLFNAGVQELIKENRQQQKQIDDLTTRLVRLEQIILNLT